MRAESFDEGKYWQIGIKKNLMNKIPYSGLFSKQKFFAGEAKFKFQRIKILQITNLEEFSTE